MKLEFKTCINLPATLDISSMYGASNSAGMLNCDCLPRNQHKQEDPHLMCLALCRKITTSISPQRIQCHKSLAVLDHLGNLPVNRGYTLPPLPAVMQSSLQAWIDHCTGRWNDCSTWKVNRKKWSKWSFSVHKKTQVHISKRLHFWYISDEKALYIHETKTLDAVVLRRSCELLQKLIHNPANHPYTYSNKNRVVQGSKWCSLTISKFVLINRFIDGSFCIILWSTDQWCKSSTRLFSQFQQ